jgi:hypothetical protein
MTDAILATLHSYKSLATRKQLQVTLEIPEEYAATALKMLGIVDPSGSQWFALTRAKIGETIENTPKLDKPKIPFRDMPRSQQAGILLGKPEFQAWFGDFYKRFHGLTSAPNDLDTALKDYLGIFKSKSELDFDEGQQPKWDALLTDYEVRGLTR